MRAQWYDALVAIPGCDKNMPGCVIAMARLNRPALMVYGGMYTANTMAVAIEALGLSLPYSSSLPADEQAKADECRRAGSAIRTLLERDLKPLDILTRDAFENAMVMVMAVGGSTNAVLH